MVDPMKKLKNEAGEPGTNPGAAITLNIKNLHIHMDERMNNTTYYPGAGYDNGAGCCDSDGDNDEPFDEYMDQGDWDEDEPDADCCFDCPDRDTCANSEFADMNKPPIGSLHALLGDEFPAEELVEVVSDKTGVGVPAVFRVLNGFIKCMDERSAEIRKAHTHTMKKGAAYEG